MTAMGSARRVPTRKARAASVNRPLTEPAPAGAYDFITYFECSDADLPIFHQVCAALRDVTRNPEWRFVREGPTWQGRRVASWPELSA
jgi:hypothetical protein